MTSIGARPSPGKFSVIAAESITAILDCGSARSSIWPNLAPTAGHANSIKTAVLPITTGQGLRIIARANVAHRAPRFGLSIDRRIRSELIRGPSSPSTAGRTITAPMTAKATTEIPPKANERKKNCGKKSRAASVNATVRPEKTTVLPALATVRATAALTSLPLANSSRNRLTISSE